MRAVVVTGGLGPLAAAAASAFAAAGDRVVLLGPGAPSSASQRVAGFHDVDLTRPDRADEAFDMAVGWLGGLDVLVNAALVYPWEIAPSDGLCTPTRLFELTVATCLNASLAAQPHLDAGARIVNIGAARSSTIADGGHAVAMAAIARLTVSLAGQLAPRRIAVNAVLADIIDTPVNRAALDGDTRTRWSRLDAVTDVILFLASDAASRMTGQLIAVDPEGAERLA